MCYNGYNIEYKIVLNNMLNIDVLFILRVDNFNVDMIKKIIILINSCIKFTIQKLIRDINPIIQLSSKIEFEEFGWIFENVHETH